MKKEISIRMSGLGGQGVVTAAHILGQAAVLEKKNATVNPFFGAEKRLAPAESYVRISESEIYDVGEVVYPDIIMIYHPDVILKGKSYTMPFYSGIRKNGIIIANYTTEFSLDETDKEELKKSNVKLYFVPATKIALEVGNTELSTNIAMLGYLAGITDVVSLDSLKQSAYERFAGKTKFVASATTAALDESVKKQYAKIEQLISSNNAILEKAYKEAKSIIS
ncbi:MAG: 2-oxoacid:acceptor oxidoreductase family protein [Endomicrobia bacterium]|nr:2-oxoacid:acceptor oxidoreductase family protein [Endomicrobiia bacterium]MDW8056400.1 2-oxoacid:acceptor oxidoreductase family protein [Elusimicrobiota bacterium]